MNRLISAESKADIYSIFTTGNKLITELNPYSSHILKYVMKLENNLLKDNLGLKKHGQEFLKRFKMKQSLLLNIQFAFFF